MLLSNWLKGFTLFKSDSKRSSYTSVGLLVTSDESCLLNTLYVENNYGLQGLLKTILWQFPLSIVNHVLIQDLRLVMPPRFVRLFRPLLGDSTTPCSCVQCPLYSQTTRAPAESRIAPAMGVPTNRAIPSNMKRIPFRVLITLLCGEMRTRIGPDNDTYFRQELWCNDREADHNSKIARIGDAFDDAVYSELDIM